MNVRTCRALNTGLWLGSVWLASLLSSPAQTAPTLGLALDATNLVWTTGSNAPADPWIGQTSVTHDGVAAVQGGGLGRGTVNGGLGSADAWIETTVTGPTNVTFWWKLALRTNTGRASFLIGTTTAAWVYHDVDWEPHTIEIPQGVRKLQWKLSKGTIFVNTEDRLWLDQVSFSGPLAPEILIQPTNQLVLAGAQAAFAVQVLGTEPLAYQWLCNGTNVLDATNRSLALPNSQPGSPCDFTVVVTNAYGSLTSQVATLTVTDAPPTFSLQPRSQGAYWGSTVSFSGAVTGSEPLAWQWYFNGDALADATTSSLSVSNVQPASFGAYWAVATNDFGSAASRVATLSSSPVTIWEGWSSSVVPPDATNVLALTGGDNHYMALRADGRVLAWGLNHYGQTDVPPNATNVIAIAAGSMHGLALREDGAVIRWGPIFNSQRLETPPGATNVVALAVGAGAEHALVLRADGNVVEIGNDNYGLTNIPLSVFNIVGIAAGALHSVALRADGKVFAWGKNWNDSETVVPTSATNAVAVAAGWHHSLVLRRDGSLVAWGWNADGQTKIPPEATNIVAIACGGVHSLALRADGRLFVWGDNDNGQTNTPPWATNLIAIAGTSYDSMALAGGPEPMFTQQPRSCAARLSESPRFIASVCGATPMKLQWLRNGEPLAGENNPWLILPPVTNRDEASYSLVASNTFATSTSRVVMVTLSPLPHIVEQPPGVVAVPSNAVVRLRVTALSTSPLNYAWQFNGVNLDDAGRITGADTSLLTISGIQPEDLGAYTAVVANDYGFATSTIAFVRFGTSKETLAEAVDLPNQTFTLSGSGFFYETDTTADGLDAARSAPIGDSSSTSFSTTNRGPIALSFSWKVSSETNADTLSISAGPTLSISGETGWEDRSIWLANATPYTPTWRYSKNASGAVGQDCGWVDRIQFGAPILPSLVEGPCNMVAFGNTNVTFRARATGTEPFKYYWRRDGNVVNSTTPSGDSRSHRYTFPAVSGQYSVSVSNVAGVTSSALATLLALPPEAARQPSATLQTDGSLRLDWVFGTLESAPTPLGPWVTVPGAVSPALIPPEGAAAFYRIRLL